MILPDIWVYSVALRMYSNKIIVIIVVVHARVYYYALFMPRSSRSLGTVGWRCVHRARVF